MEIDTKVLRIIFGSMRNEITSTEENHVKKIKTVSSPSNSVKSVTSEKL